MKSPIEILKHKQRLERLLLAIRAKVDNSEEYFAAAKTAEKLQTKIEALEWVLSEKP